MMYKAVFLKLCLRRSFETVFCFLALHDPRGNVCCLKFETDFETPKHFLSKKPFHAQTMWLRIQAHSVDIQKINSHPDALVSDLARPYWEWTGLYFIAKVVGLLQFHSFKHFTPSNERPMQALSEPLDTCPLSHPCVPVEVEIALSVSVQASSSDFLSNPRLSRVSAPPYLLRLDVSWK